LPVSAYSPPTRPNNAGDTSDDVHLLPWLITAYVIASTAVTPLYGKISDPRPPPHRHRRARDPDGGLPSHEAQERGIQSCGGERPVSKPKLEVSHDRFVG
jgi:hypothetical protein